MLVASTAARCSCAGGGEKARGCVRRWHRRAASGRAVSSSWRVSRPPRRAGQDVLGEPEAAARSLPARRRQGEAHPSSLPGRGEQLFGETRGRQCQLSRVVRWMRRRWVRPERGIGCQHAGRVSRAWRWRRSGRSISASPGVPRHRSVPWRIRRPAAVSVGPLKARLRSARRRRRRGGPRFLASAIRPYC